MPTVKVTDQDGRTLLSTVLGAGGGLGKYVKAATELRASRKLAGALKRPLSDVSEQAGRELDLSLVRDLPVGDSALTIDAAAHAAVGVHPSGSTLFAGDDLRDAVLVPNGSSYVSLSLAARLKAGLEGERGALSFGFAAGTGLEYRFFQPFDLASGDPLLGDALSRTLESAVIPATASELAAMPIGAHATLAGAGHIEISGEVAMSAATTVLATPGLPLVGGLALAQGASVSVGATWSASGELELRVTKNAAQLVQIAYYRRRSTTLAIDAKASLGISATVGDSELLKLLFGAIRPNPSADLVTLVNAGLEDDQIEAIQQAIAASVDRSLSLAAELQFSSMRQGEALFAYDIDLDALDEQGRAAVTQALHGTLTDIERLADIPGRGVRLAASGLARLRERRIGWRINLFGALNVASIEELIRLGTVSFDPASGSLNAADRITSNRILVKSRPLESDTEKLRKVVFESLIVTAAYHCSRAIGTLDLTACHTYVEQHSPTRRTEMKRHYDAIIALALSDAAERDRRLGSATDFGPSTFLLECRLDRHACDQLFLDPAGQPHDVGHYERIAREAFLALLPPDDPDRSFRRLPLERETVWEQMRLLGQASLAEALPAHIRNDALRVAAVVGDYSTIVWWAGAMARAGRALVEVRKFIAGRSAESIGDDVQFKKHRARLEEALAKVVVTTEARWGDPWDIIALDAASDRRAATRAVIVSPRLSVAYEEPRLLDESAGALESVSPAAASARSRGGLDLRPGSGRARELTSGERQTLQPFVVNLRDGTFSGSGAFATTDAGVRRIFTELLPAEIAERKAAGGRLRLLFYAHGGLVEEIDGLLAVLRAHRFWRMNNVYPLFFVWETGLKETLSDIARGLTEEGPRASRGPLGGLTDAVIEATARNAGGPVWSQMKRSAEKAARAGGGARIVAELTRDLWAAHADAMEIHAVGHSAGAIFHAHFLPLLTEQSVSGAPAIQVRTLHLLAPAITTSLFKSTLKDLVGPAEPIRSLTMYTMNDELERKDVSTKPYGKSLLYLVSRSFEAERNAAILGLQRSLNDDLGLIRYFGLAGRTKVADVLFSVTPTSAPFRDRTTSTRHGGFDNDAATMTSVVRRVLDVPDTEAVQDYFEDSVASRGRPPITRAVSPERPSRPGAPERRSGARPTAEPHKPWTVLVWMAGDNDLESFALTDLQEMGRVGSTDAVNIVAQLDSMADDRTRRYFIRPNSRPADDVVEELGETNTGDPAVAIDFFVWGIQRYPSDQVLAVIWNHGSGIDETDVYARAAARGVTVERGVAPGARTVPRANVRTMLARRYRRALFSTTLDEAMNTRAIAYDDSARDFLDNAELKRVLEQVKRETGREIDLLGFDACLMNMLEIAYQLRTTARFIVGSEEVEPGDGWPYDKVLADLTATPTLSAAELGATIVKRYIASYRGQSVTQSLLDLQRVDACAEAVDLLAAALIKSVKTPVEYAAITKALKATLRFDMAEFVDLGHLCSELAARSKAAAVKKAAKAVLAAVSGPDGLVAAEAHKGLAMSRAQGVAIYVPRGAAAKTYGRLDFAKQTKWDEFLSAYGNA